MQKPLMALVAASVAGVALAAGSPNPAAAPASPTAASTAQPGSAAIVKGQVLEVIDVDAYTYLRLKTPDGEVWAAVTKAPVKKGADVTISDVAVMRNFESRTLKRTFPAIYFGTLGAPAAAAPAKAAAANAPAQPTLGQIHGGASKSDAVTIAKVAKAAGPTGRTVAEVYAQGASLKDKPVAIHATVVKVNANVMGKNWVHLRDGTGSAADGSNDLLATSKDEPKVGDVVVAKGVVKTDVNLGSGYAYKVLVENASFGK